MIVRRLICPKTIPIKIKLHTEILKLNRRAPEIQGIKKAARVIRRGGLVAFPTETVYGLGADALNPRAVRKIFVAKGRPSDNPLIVHICRKQDIRLLARDIPVTAQKLTERFWPGPLTLVLKKSKRVPKVTSGGLDTVAIRMPKNSIAQNLIREADTPIAAPSANYFGRPSPTTARHVLEDMSGKIGLILDGGPAKIGIESTVIDLTETTPMLLRPGGITLEQLEKAVGKIRIHPVLKGKKSKGIHRSPGMKYKHYSPDAKVILIEGPPAKVRKKTADLAKTLRRQNERVGLIANDKSRYDVDELIFVGSGPEKFASSLFKTFRKFDSKKISVILVQSVPKEGLGMGIMNRLEKAAAKKIIVR